MKSKIQIFEQVRPTRNMKLRGNNQFLTESQLGKKKMLISLKSGEITEKGTPVITSTKATNEKTLFDVRKSTE